MDELITSFDFEPVAWARLPRDVYNFTMAGADSEFVIRRNRLAFDWARIVKRPAIDIKTVDTASEIFGHKMAFPILVAPSSAHGTLHPSGEIGMHEGVVDHDIRALEQFQAANGDQIGRAGPGADEIHASAHSIIPAARDALPKWEDPAHQCIYNNANSPRVRFSAIVPAAILVFWSYTAAAWISWFQATHD